LIEAGAARSARHGKPNHVSFRPITPREFLNVRRRIYLNGIDWSVYVFPQTSGGATPRADVLFLHGFPDTAYGIILNNPKF
jgi:hypothetical protein